MKLSKNIIALAALLLASLVALLAADGPELTAKPNLIFRYSPADGLGPEADVMRRDPSDVIRVGDLYYVWYSKGKVAHGYDATVWYATSRNGHAWIEKRE